jgi:xylitol oxidase
VDQISLKHLDDMTLDHVSDTVTIGGGVTYGPLCQFLDANGHALANMASLPHVTVAGACATATHGSGDSNGNLATAVEAMEIVTSEGDIVHLTPRSHDFRGAVVNLGAIGVVTHLTLHIEPAFTDAQAVYENLPLERLATDFNDIFSGGYSVSLFLDWQHRLVSQAWIKHRLPTGSSWISNREFFGGILAKRRLHPVQGQSHEAVREQLGIAGPSHERLPHFRMEFTPSSGDELQSEYILPRDTALPAILAVEGLADTIAPHLQISELRTMHADDLWMSPNYSRPSLGLHFTWKPDWDAVREILPEIEERLAPFDARPHWGKLFTMSGPRIVSLYERFDDFRRLRSKYDPKGKFLNEFLASTLPGL